MARIEQDGASLRVVVTLLNETDHHISFWRTVSPGLYPIHVADETGKPLPDKRPGFRNGRFDPKLLDSNDPRVASGEIVSLLSGKLICVTLKPGETVVDRVDVASFFDLPKSGTYVVSLEGACGRRISVRMRAVK